MQVQSGYSHNPVYFKTVFTLTVQHQCGMTPFVWTISSAGRVNTEQCHNIQVAQTSRCLFLVSASSRHVMQRAYDAEWPKPLHFWFPSFSSPAFSSHTAFVRHFSVLHFPALHFCPSFSCPAFSSPSLLSVITAFPPPDISLSVIFLSCIFSAPSWGYRVVSASLSRSCIVSKRLKIQPHAVANRKPYPSFWMVPFPMTLSDP